MYVYNTLYMHLDFSINRFIDQSLLKPHKSKRNNTTEQTRDFTSSHLNVQPSQDFRIKLSILRVIRELK